MQLFLFFSLFFFFFFFFSCRALGLLLQRVCVCSNNIVPFPVSTSIQHQEDEQQRPTEIPGQPKKGEPASACITCVDISRSWPCSLVPRFILRCLTALCSWHSQFILKEWHQVTSASFAKATLAQQRQIYVQRNKHYWTLACCTCSTVVALKRNRYQEILYFPVFSFSKAS